MLKMSTAWLVHAYQLPVHKIQCSYNFHFFYLFRTILYVSLVYALGNLVVSLTALPGLGAGEIPGPMIGLFLIALGTGGIKPCVSAFGGDQISADQTKLLQSFFSVFYFAINAGSLLSMLITPVLRGQLYSRFFSQSCISGKNLIVHTK